MAQQHLSRLAAPAPWPIVRKVNKWVLRQYPGRHALTSSLPLGFVLRDVLSVAKTMKEVKYILHQGLVSVNGVVCRDPHVAVGFLDVVGLSSLHEYYRVVYTSRGKLHLLSIPASEKDLRLLRLVQKTVVSGGRLQLNFHEGTNIFVQESSAAVGDSILYDGSSKKIVAHYPLAKDAFIYLCGGHGIGTLGTVVDLVTRTAVRRARVLYDVQGQSHVTDLRYAFVVGSHQKVALRLTA